MLNHFAPATDAGAVFRRVGHVESQQVGYLMPSQGFEERLEASLHAAQETDAGGLNIAHTRSPANPFDRRSTHKGHPDAADGGWF